MSRDQESGEIAQLNPSLSASSTQPADMGFWTKISGMEILPEAELISPWQQSGSFTIESLLAGVLTVQTSDINPGIFIHPDVRFNNTYGTTAEIKLKLFQGPTTDRDACLFCLQDGAREGKLSFFNDRLEIYDQNDLILNHKMDTTDNFHIYRVAIIQDTIEIYIDGLKILSLNLINRIDNTQIIFGDGSIKPEENFWAEIDYIAYSVQGAFSPEGQAITPQIVVAIETATPASPSPSTPVLPKVTGKQGLDLSSYIIHKLIPSDIEVSSSHLSHGKENLLAQADDLFWHVKFPKETSESWVMVDLGYATQIDVVAVRPRIGFVEQLWRGDSAVLEGSEDKQNWTPLVKLDIEIENTNGTEWIAFVLPGELGYYRYFRIFITDRDFLSLSGLALYVSVNGLPATTP